MQVSHVPQDICMYNINLLIETIDRPCGAKYSLDEIREMVKADESMQNLVHEEQQEYITKLNECHALQNMSIRATNTAAAWDVQSTLDNVFKMVGSMQHIV